MPVFISDISWAILPGKRPRAAGKNARLGTHGTNADIRIARIAAGGYEGFGWCTASREQAKELLGLSLNEMFDTCGMLKNEYLQFEFPILDLVGKLLHMPVYKLVSNAPGSLEEPFSVPVYDTSIYFDELHIDNDKEAVDFICSEVEYGLNQNHKNFKIKIGRCAMWMEHNAGMQRDIEIVLAIRKLVGPDVKLMVDANNGFNLSITKFFLKETKDAGLFWIEEPFHEDNMQLKNLRDWMRENEIKTLLADGEGYASPVIEDWAKAGIIDVLQYDIKSYGFFKWIALSRELAPYNTFIAPHNYGGFYGNFAAAHLASATDRFSFAEYDEMSTEGVDTSGYTIKEGRLYVPEADGFGLFFDNKTFKAYSSETGWRI